jgi:hypothetical protein
MLAIKIPGHMPPPIPGLEPPANLLPIAALLLLPHEPHKEIAEEHRQSCILQGVGRGAVHYRLGAALVDLLQFF